MRDINCGWCSKEIEKSEPFTRIAVRRATDPGGRSTEPFHVGNCTKNIEKKLGRDPS